MLLYGAGGHAKVVIDCLKSQAIAVRAIFDDDPDKKSLLGIEILNDYSSIIHRSEEIIISIGANAVRKKISQELDHSLGTIFHASAIISDHTNIGVGTVVCQGAVIQSGAKIGEHSIINTSAVVEHDAILEDFVHIGPGAVVCGGCSVGEGTLIGANATILPGVSIGKWSEIGAGSVITKDIEERSIVYGNPGQVIKKKQIER